MSLAMTQPEREAFLAGVHVGVLSVVEADGKPIGVPVWYTYEPGRDISVHIDPGSRKGKALTATGRFSLCAQSEELPYKYVLVTGRVRESRAPSEVERRELAYRYLGPEFGESYLEATRDEAAGILRFLLQPDQWMTVDYGKQFGG
jgi:nitroimidazol reductase NimA-like FMN-containing flavoprotein (pyridoxamine 5'-phosphate oxidase superfamily)